MRRLVMLLAALGVVFAGVVSSAFAASTVSLCVPSGEGAAITTPSKGSCGSGTSVQLPAEKAEQEKLIAVLPHINYQAEGVDKKPTVQFTGVNLQVIDGSGSETTVNGTGNLILGYDEKAKTQTGSHNLLVGGVENSYSSYGGILGGAHSNTINGPYASVLGGAENTATGTASTITGGHSSKTNASYSTINGGCGNFTGAGTYAVSGVCTTAYANDFTTVDGGAGNQAEAENSTVAGGYGNKGTGLTSTILGGKDFTEGGEYGVSAGLAEAEQNKLFAIVPYLGYEGEGIDKKPTVQFTGANLQVLSGTGHTNGTPNGEGNLMVGYDETPGAQTGMNNLVVGGFTQSFTSYGAIVGGSGNTASGPSTDVFGIENVATLDGASVTGGAGNTASGDFSSVSGGYSNVASNTEASVSGGTNDEAGGEDASVSGGYINKAQGAYDSISGGGENTDEASGELDSILGGVGNKLTGSYEIYPAAP